MQFHHPTPIRRARLAARGGAVGAALMMIVSALTMLAPAHAAGTLQGAAQIVDGSAQAAPLASGNSGTDFRLKLPSGAACAGDSTNDEWRWQTYVVPSATDPATLTFANTSPTGPATGASFRQALYTTTGSPVTNQQTADKTPPSTEGPIIGIPLMDFAVWGPGDIGPGTYNVGIACTKGPASSTQMDRFWNTQLTFAADAANGGPAQVSWTAQQTTSTTTTSTTIAGATTTTSTTIAGATTTTSTTIASGATTTTSTTLASGASTTTTSAAGTGAPTTSAPGSSVVVARTGSSDPTVTIFWALVLVLLGGIARSLGRRPHYAHSRKQ